MKNIVIISIFLSNQLLTQTLFPTRNGNGEARNRSYDVLHYKIEVSFDEPNKKVMGKVSTTLVPLLSDVKEIAFDAEQISFSKVMLGKKELKYDSLAKSILIHLDKSYSYRDTISLSIEYSATPKKGMYFVQPDSGYPNKPQQIWTQGEDMDNHFWLPCYDFPNDKATSEVIVTVKNNQVAVSNGKLFGVKEDKKNGTKTFSWKMSKPHSSYLIMLAVGKYAVLSEKGDGIPLEYYVYPNEVNDAKECFKETPNIMKFFNQRIGYRYPWEKYAQVCIAEFMFGGMENTTATTLADNITVYDARTRVDNSPTSLIAHEMAHQWWGDVLTCKDWRHLWLNESFASYFDPLYSEFSKGRDEFDYQMYNAQLAGINSDRAFGRKPIVSVGSYSSNIYPRGASVLHMLRFILGDSLFWRSINHYITKNQFTPVETNDFKNAIEETTGQNLYWFFEEWVYKAGYPKFDVAYTWNDSAKTISLSVKQTQTMDSLTGAFHMPIDIEVTTSHGAETHRVNIASKDTTFTLPSSEQPQLVIFDKGNWLIKELNFEKSHNEWMYQAEFAKNPIDRLRAVQHFVKANDRSCAPLLARTARNDSFWAVKIEAINAFEKIDTLDDKSKALAKEALVAETKNAKSKVRNAAVVQLKNFKGSDVTAALRSALSDSSYSVVASAITSLAKVDSANVLSIITTFSDTKSYRNQIGNAVLNVIATMDSAQAITIAMKKARYGEDVFGRNTALGVLQKVGKNRKDIVALYVSLLSDKNVGVRNNVITRLGEVGDESVIPALEKIANDAAHPSSNTAKASIEKLKKK